MHGLFSAIVLHRTSASGADAVVVTTTGAAVACAATQTMPRRNTVAQVPGWFKVVEHTAPTLSGDSMQSFPWHTPRWHSDAAHDVPNGWPLQVATVDAALQSPPKHNPGSADAVEHLLPSSIGSV
jgi:hypothetical protein